MVRTARSAAISSPRAASRPRTPPVIIASTTSLTVPPTPARTALTSARSTRAQLHTRWGPIGPVKDDLAGRIDGAAAARGRRGGGGGCGAAGGPRRAAQEVRRPARGGARLLDRVERPPGRASQQL